MPEDGFRRRSIAGVYYISTLDSHGKPPFKAAQLKPWPRPCLKRRGSSCAGAAKDMVELFARLRGLKVEFEGDKDTGRDIQL